MKNKQPVYTAILKMYDGQSNNKYVFTYLTNVAVTVKDKTAINLFTGEEYDIDQSSFIPGSVFCTVTSPFYNIKKEMVAYEILNSNIFYKDILAIYKSIPVDQRTDEMRQRVLDSSQNIDIYNTIINEQGKIVKEYAKRK